MAFGDYVTLEVGDTGVGMTPDVPARIFELLYHQTDRHGHRAWPLDGIRDHPPITRPYPRKSAPGRGTQFQVLFPGQLARTKSLTPVIAEPGDAVAFARVLLVDDDPAVRRALCRALTNGQVSVVEAGDATTALELLRSDPNPIDLVITDMVMPGKSGVDPIREIRRYRPDLPAIGDVRLFRGNEGRGMAPPRQRRLHGETHRSRASSSSARCGRFSGDRVA